MTVQDVWTATYGAAYARMALDHFNEGRGALTPEQAQRVAEEAGSIADDAVEHCPAELDGEEGPEADASRCVACGEALSIDAHACGAVAR